MIIAGFKRILCISLSDTRGLPFLSSNLVVLCAKLFLNRYITRLNTIQTSLLCVHVVFPCISWVCILKERSTVFFLFIIQQFHVQLNCWGTTFSTSWTCKFSLWIVISHDMTNLNHFQRGIPISRQSHTGRSLHWGLEGGSCGSNFGDLLVEKLGIIPMCDRCLIHLSRMC